MPVWHDESLIADESRDYGFGVREATFSFYFTRVGLPIESAVLLSLVAAALTMVHSLSGAAVYITRKR